MAKGIAEINVSDSDELRLKKINENFRNLVTGSTPVGALSSLGGGYLALAGSIGSSVINSPQLTSSLLNNDGFISGVYSFSAEYITADTIGVGNLEAQYARIDLANIQNLAVKHFYSQIGLIDNAVLSEGHVTGKLSAVSIDAANIMAETITADKIVFSDGSSFDSVDAYISSNQGLFKVLNQLIANADSTLLQRMQEVAAELELDWSDPDQRDQVLYYFDSKIDGKALIAKTITAEQIYVTDLYAFNAKIGGFTIDGENGLVGNYEDGGIIEFRPSGYFRAGNTETYIAVDPGQNKLDIECSNTNIKEDLTIAQTWKWDFEEGILNLSYIGN